MFPLEQVATRTDSIRVESPIVSQDDVSTAIRSLDLPAEGPRLQEARDSVRAAYDYLAVHGSATSTDLKIAVYPEFESSSYFAVEDADSWFDRYVGPGLTQLPGVRREGNGWKLRESSNR